MRYLLLLLLIVGCTGTDCPEGHHKIDFGDRQVCDVWACPDGWIADDMGQCAP